MPGKEGGGRGREEDQGEGGGKEGEGGGNWSVRGKRLKRYEYSGRDEKMGLAASLAMMIR